MRTTRNTHPAETLAALLTLTLLALCLLAVLLAGAGTCRRLTERGRASGDSRTAAQYLATRVRQADAAGTVSLEPFGTGNALVLEEAGCRTWVYCHDGWLRELFTAGEGTFAPEDGERLLEAESLALSWQAGCLTADIDVGGLPETVVLYLRSGEEAAP